LFQFDFVVNSLTHLVCCVSGQHRVETMEKAEARQTDSNKFASRKSSRHEIERSQVNTLTVKVKQQKF
jgi:hypothetical protein